MLAAPAASAAGPASSFSALQPLAVVALEHHHRHVVGVVRFRGSAAFAAASTENPNVGGGGGDVVVGVELAFPSGSCDGERGGTQFFSTDGTLTMAGVFLSERTATDSGTRVLGTLGDGGPGDAAWTGFPREWNRRRGGADSSRSGGGDDDARPQFVLKILHSKFPLVEEVALSRGWCVVTGPPATAAAVSDATAVNADAVERGRDGWDLCWSDNVQVLQQGLLPGLLPGQRVNHWPLTNNLAVKALLADKLKKMRAGGGAVGAAYGFFPGTWTAPKELPALRREAVEAAANAATGAADSASGVKAQDGSNGRAGGSGGEGKAAGGGGGEGGGGGTAAGAARRTFIVKPPGAAEGRGIFLVHDLAAWLAESYPPKASAGRAAGRGEGPGAGGAGTGSSGGSAAVASKLATGKTKRPVLLVQEYLDRPLLVDGLKFDLRVYVLVTSIAPLRVYVYDDGLARFCTSPYVAPAPGNVGDLKMHLTNYAVNVKGENFDGDAAEDVGTKRTLQAILKWMRSNGHDADQFLREMDAAIVKTVIAVQRLSTAAYRKANPRFAEEVAAPAATPAEADARSGCFEVMGFDVFIDEDLRPWIIEVNIAPSFKTDAPLDHRIKFGVLNDAFDLMGVDKGYWRPPAATDRSGGDDKTAQEKQPKTPNGWRLALPVEDPEQQAAYERWMKYSNVNVSRFMRFD